MKNKIIILLTLLLFVSCSNLKSNEKNAEKKYEILLNNWELDKLNSLLESNSNPVEMKVTEKYKILLQERIKEKSDLESMIEKLKFDLKSNNFANLEMYFNDSFVNRKIISEIKKIDFSEFEIMISKPKLYKNTASNTAAVIFRDQVEYFQFYYKLSNKKWSIIEIKDGR